MTEDLWRALTKTALRILTGRRERHANLNAADITEATLALFSDVPDANAYRARLHMFVADMLRQ